MLLFIIKCNIQQCPWVLLSFVSFFIFSNQNHSIPATLKPNDWLCIVGSSNKTVEWQSTKTGLEEKKKTVAGNNDINNTDADKNVHTSARTYNMIYNINNRPSMWPNNDLTVLPQSRSHFVFRSIFIPSEKFTVIIIIFNVWLVGPLTVFSAACSSIHTWRRKKNTRWIIQALTMFHRKYFITFSFASMHTIEWCEIA